MDYNLHILIVEDELLIAEMLKDMLIDMDYKVVGIAKNFQSGIDLLHQKKEINFAILDINLNETHTGFDMANTLRELSIPFVFLTSYSDKKTIQDALVYHPNAFLIKPFSKLDLYTTLEIVKKSKKQTSKFVIIKDGHLNVKLAVSSILWIKSENVYIEVVTNEKTYLVRTSLDKFLEELDDKCIMRIHRSYLINLNHVSAINGMYVIIRDEKIPLSRKFREEIMHIFQRKKGLD
ncbi:MAG: response regulator transcription factor [Chitinophagales bacterium]|nr:response regulator transcription factor [Chitinophagales bacterium]